jgi:hypothetical protein
MCGGIEELIDESCAPEDLEATVPLEAQGTRKDARHRHPSVARIVIVDPMRKLSHPRAAQRRADIAQI